MKMVTIGKAVRIPVENGKMMMDKAKEELSPDSFRQYEGCPVYLGSIGKSKENEARKRLLQDIATGKYYWEIFDPSSVRTEIVGDYMMMKYCGADGKGYGLMLVTTEKEILRRMDVRR